MPYTQEEIDLLKKIRLANKKRYQKSYYERTTKPLRQAKRLSLNK